METLVALIALVVIVAIIIALAIAIIPYLGIMAVGIAVLVVLGLVVYVTGRILSGISGTLRTITTNNPVPIDSSPLPAAQPSEPPDKSLIPKLQRIRSELASTEAAEAAESARQLNEDAAIKDARERIKAAEAWMNQSGVGEALQEILSELYFWPWASPPWTPDASLGFLQPRASKQQQGNKERYVFEFTVHDHRFVLGYGKDRSASWKSGRWEEVSLGYDRAEVFRGNVLEMSAPPHWGKVSDVRVLATGEWAATVLEIASRVRLRRQRAEHEHKASEAAKLREKAAALPPTSTFKSSPSN